MSDISNDLYTNVRAVMKAAWPEVSAIYEETQVNTLTIPDLVSKMPYGVISVTEQRDTTDYRVLDAYNQLVACYYVMEMGGTLTVLRQKQNLLREAFNATPTVNIAENVDLRNDDALPMNALLGSKNGRIRAGRFAFIATIGEPWVL